MIQTLLAMGIKASFIVHGLGRCASTLSRELHRNGRVCPKAPRGPGRPAVAGSYRVEVAHAQARDCTVTPRVKRRLYPGGVLWDEVMHYLKRLYSPEQIAGMLALVHAQPPHVAGFS